MLKVFMGACSAFYERIKEVREYHRRYPCLEVAEVSTSLGARILVCSP